MEWASYFRYKSASFVPCSGGPFANGGTLFLTSETHDSGAHMAYSSSVASPSWYGYKTITVTNLASGGATVVGTYALDGSGACVLTWVPGSIFATELRSTYSDAVTGGEVYAEVDARLAAVAWSPWQSWTVGSGSNYTSISRFGKTLIEYQLRIGVMATTYLRIWFSRQRNIIDGGVSTGWVDIEPIEVTVEDNYNGRLYVQPVLDEDGYIIDGDYYTTTFQVVEDAALVLDLPAFTFDTESSVEERLIQIKYSYVRDYEPDISDPMNPQPSGFPDPAWEPSPP